MQNNQQAAAPAPQLRRIRTPRLLSCAALTCSLFASAHGQVLTPPRTENLLGNAVYSSVPAASNAGAAAAPALPEAPLPQSRSEDLPRPQFGDPKPAPGSTPAHEIAPKYTKFIPGGWTAQKLTAHDKIVMGAQDLYSFDNFAAMVLSAGYAHIANGEPNYGSDKRAFGQRLGAAAVRETSQGIFTDMVFGNLLHQDTRYHALGPNAAPMHRFFYAISRPILSRKDDGSPTVNGALLLGYAASAALTPAFYPQVNRNFHDTAATYGASVGGSAIGFFISEFSNDVFYKVHLRRTP